ncbi:MAG: HDIG domain-containing protein [Spirochaetes bacterium]|nr:HDIG domain-containing protein [Spirochaetota bacterium]
MKTEVLLSLPFVQDILNNEDFKSLQNYIHHGTTTCYQHTLEVAQLAYRLASLLKLDYVAATRGALLHDFFMYNWRTGGPRLHGFRHPRIALNNSLKYFILSKKEMDSILRHMWPLTPLPPRYPESWIVTIADKIVSIKDYSNYLRVTITEAFSTIKVALAKIAVAIALVVQSWR